MHRCHFRFCDQCVIACHNAHYFDVQCAILMFQIDTLRATLREAEENERKQSTELRRLREELASVQGRCVLAMSPQYVFIYCFLIRARSSTALLFRSVPILLIFLEQHFLYLYLLTQFPYANLISYLYRLVGAMQAVQLANAESDALRATAHTAVHDEQVYSRWHCGCGAL